MEEKDLKEDIAGEIATTFLSGLATGTASTPLGWSVLAAAAGLLVVKGVFLQTKPRSVEEIIKSIADNVANEVLASIKAAAPDDKNSTRQSTIESALLDLRDALRASKVTVQLLIDLQLDATQLAQHIMAHHPTKMLSMSELRRHVFTKAVQHCAHDIMEVAPNLPGFQALFARSVLRKLGEQK